MAGGIGTRFWPYSRKSYPKQFIDLLGTNKSLLQATVDRFLKLVPKEQVFILTNIAYKNLVLEQLPYLKTEQVFLEPIMRNTAPSIAFAAYKIRSKDPEANLVFSPSDHLIQDEKSFINAIEKSLFFSRNTNSIGILGIKPNQVHTGYGYIQYDKTETSKDLLKVKSFTEKPGKKMAETFVQSGDFLWNAGIFCWNVRTIVHVFNQLYPEMANLFNELSSVFFTEKEAEPLEKAFYTSPNISIDYAIMERILLGSGINPFHVYVLPCHFDWSDLGAWNTLFDTIKKNKDNNVLDGTIITYDTNNCIVKTPKDRLVVLNGLQNFIVAEKDNVLLISDRKDEQKLKEFYKDAQKKNPKFS